MPAVLDHFEIPVVDADRLTGFLEAVFGWAADEASESVDDRIGSTGSPGASGRYRRLAAAAAGHGSTESRIRIGLYEGAPEVLDRAMPVVRLTGEALEGCLERVASAGGRVVLEPKAIGNSGRFARFEDPEGNPWGLWQPAPAARTST